MVKFIDKTESNLYFLTSCWYANDNFKLIKVTYIFNVLRFVYINYRSNLFLNIFLMTLHL